VLRIEERYIALCAPQRSADVRGHGGRTPHAPATFVSALICAGSTTTASGEGRQADSASRHGSVF
jgi:hypothetical protein